MRTLLLLLLLAFAATGFAQQHLRGTVTDTLGRPVPFATIADAKGHALAQADSAGNFSFTVKRRPASLQVSAVSYHKTSVSLRPDAETIGVQLRANTELQEVVVSSIVCIRRWCSWGCGGCTIRRHRLPRAAKTVVAAPAVASVYPNPTSGSVTLQAPARISSLYLADMNGRALLQRQGGTENRLRIGLGSFAAGTYLLRYYVEGSGWRTDKVVLQR